MKKFNTVTFLCSLLLPLLVGIVSALISRTAMAEYGSMNKPPLSPPAWLFPVAWTILYLMMGLASYCLIQSDPDHPGRIPALILYALQLAMNFVWSIIFFNLGMYLFAFIWLFVLWMIVIACTFITWDISRSAAILLIPYILWLTFAGYLNLGAFILNRA